MAMLEGGAMEDDDGEQTSSSEEEGEAATVRPSPTKKARHRDTAPPKPAAAATPSRSPFSHTARPRAIRTFEARDAPSQHFHRHLGAFNILRKTHYSAQTQCLLPIMPLKAIFEVLAAFSAQACVVWFLKDAPHLCNELVRSVYNHGGGAGREDELHP